VASYAGTTQLLSGGIVTTSGGKTIHTFNASGSLDLHSATISGNISGAGDLIWNKAGTLGLNGANSYTGTTTISLGIVSLSGLIGSTSDLSFGSGSLFLASTGVINVLQSNYSLADAAEDIGANRITGAFAPQVSTFNDGFNTYTQISAIPEPSTALLGGLGLLALLRRRR
jgi:autotransporter-associated beta strand protein